MVTLPIEPSIAKSLSLNPSNLAIPIKSRKSQNWDTKNLTKFQSPVPELTVAQFDALTESDAIDKFFDTIRIDKIEKVHLKAFIDDAILMPHRSLPDTYNITATGFRKLL